MKEYNKSVQIMKLIAAFFVVLLHSMGHGGILQNVQIHTVSYYICWLLESLAYVAVDVFIISMGYYMIHQKSHIGKIFNIYFEVLWYMIIGLVVAFLFSKKVLLSDIVCVTFPFSREAYGFVTSYVGVYLLAPLINKVSDSLDKKNRKIVLISILILGSIWPTLMIGGGDYWGLNYGYSLLWFLCLYYIGGYLRDFPIKKKSSEWLLLYFIASMVSSVIGFCAREISEIIGLSFRGEGVLLHYNSITVTIAAISFFCFFAYRSSQGKNVVFWSVSNTTLGIYLLHDNIAIRRYVWLPIKGDTNIICVVLYAMVVFSLCVLFELIRKWLFKKLSVNNWAKKLENCVSRGIIRLADYGEKGKERI